MVMVTPVVTLSSSSRERSSAIQTILSSSIWQVAEQPSPETVFPSSHSSLLFFWTIPSPHTSFLHFCEQPSPLLRFPSSHCSAPSRMPFPQGVAAQAGEQESPSTVLPSSHCSNGSSAPFPQVAVAMWVA